MSGRRNTGRKRRPHDLYETPAWVVLDCLAPFFSVRGLVVREPACGTGKMVRALLDAGAAGVLAGDIIKRKHLKLAPYVPFRRADFLKLDLGVNDCDALITNPPYGEQSKTAYQFIEAGLVWLRACAQVDACTMPPRWMALLLPVDFDLALGRQHLFERCAEYHGVIRLRRRIEWFKRKPGGNGPSVNHAWFVWRSLPRAEGTPPVTYYAPSNGALL